MAPESGAILFALVTVVQSVKCGKIVTKGKEKHYELAKPDCRRSDSSASRR